MGDRCEVCGGTDRDDDLTLVEHQRADRPGAEEPCPGPELVALRARVAEIDADDDEWAPVPVGPVWRCQSCDYWCSLSDNARAHEYDADHSDEHRMVADPAAEGAPQVTRG